MGDSQLLGPFGGPLRFVGVGFTAERSSYLPCVMDRCGLSGLVVSHDPGAQPRHVR